MPKYPTQLMHWLRTHPLIALASIVGFAAGLVVRLPIIPWVLPDSAANVVGAAVGSFIAVALAAHMSDVSAHRERRRAALAVRKVIRPVLDAVIHYNVAAEYVRNEPDGPTRQWHFQDLGKKGTCLAKEMEICIERLDAMAPLLVELGPLGAVAMSDAARCLNRFKTRGRVLLVLESDSDKTNLVSLPTTADASLRRFEADIVDLVVQFDSLIS